jgi:hypothetical protein
VKSWQWYIDAIVFVGCPPNEGYGDGRWRWTIDASGLYCSLNKRVFIIIHWFVSAQF